MGSEERSWDERQQAVKAILEKETAWTHVAHNYVEHIVEHHPNMLHRRKDGRMNRSYNVARLVADLAEACDYWLYTCETCALWDEHCAGYDHAWLCCMGKDWQPREE